MADNRKTQKSMTLVRRMETPGWMKLAVPAVSIVGGLLFSAIFLLAAGESPIQVYMHGNDQGKPYPYPFQKEMDQTDLMSSVKSQHSD